MSQCQDTSSIGSSTDNVKAITTQEPKVGATLPEKPRQLVTGVVKSPEWKSNNSSSSLESNGVSVTVVQNPDPNIAKVNGTPVFQTKTNQTPGPRPSVPANSPNIIEGTAKCENCGQVGVKHAFYTKQRNYCSNACAKAASQKKTDSFERKADTKTPEMTSKAVRDKEQDISLNLPDADLDDSTSSSAQDTSRPSSAASMTPVPAPKPKSKKGKAKQTAVQYVPQEPPSYDWNTVLDDPKFEAASVICFPHVPWAKVWENITVGMKVEVENKDLAKSMQFQTAFWVATVLKIQGYKVRLRFEGYGNDHQKDFWVNLASPDVHHVGWCATKGKPLIPPYTIANRYSDWREFLVKRLTGARTLPHNFQTKTTTGFKSRYELGTRLEIVDKMRISQLRLAEVRGSVGKRLNLVYFDSADNEGFWCHEDSSLIHEEGWAYTVGQEISAPANYKPDKLPLSMFSDANFSDLNIKEGMKLEAIDPLNLSVICAATIKKVFPLGYIMVRVDCYEEDPSGSDWFCYKYTSPSIFPCGFCAKNKIPLIPPFGYPKETFKWEEYLLETKTVPAPIQDLTQPHKENAFKVGMRLEAADLMDPRLVCVATIARVIGYLLKIHFDGWEEEYDQWLDARSPDIYPVGWCEIVNHRLELPPQPVKPKPSKKSKSKKGSRSSATDGEVPSKKRKLQLKEASSQPKKSPMSDVLARTSTAEKAHLPSTETKESVNDKSSNQREDRSNSNSNKDTAGSSTTTATRIPKPGDTEFSDPEKWSKEDVSLFLENHDSEAYIESFLKSNVDGKALMSLTKDQIIALTGMKVGPGVKIYDYIVKISRMWNSANRKLSLSK